MMINQLEELLTNVLFSKFLKMVDPTVWFSIGVIWSFSFYFYFNYPDGILDFCWSHCYLRIFSIAFWIYQTLESPWVTKGIKEATFVFKTIKKKEMKNEKRILR